MMKLVNVALIAAAVLLPNAARAQQAPDPPETDTVTAQSNVPPAAQRVEADVEREVRRFRVGVQGGTGLDPEIINVGIHANVGPVFSPSVSLRPVFEIGIGELTTLLGINIDVLYTFPGTGETTWVPYVGAGPNFGLSHRGFETEDGDNVNVPGVDDADEPSRFDFSDTDFNGGMNFIVGMRKPSGVFFEMKATAWGVSNIRLLAGFNF